MCGVAFCSACVCVCVCDCVCACVSVLSMQCTHKLCMKISNSLQIACGAGPCLVITMQLVCSYPLTKDCAKVFFPDELPASSSE